MNKIVFIIFSSIVLINAIDVRHYLDLREELVVRDLRTRFDADVQLSEKELLVEGVLMKMKDVFLEGEKDRFILSNNFRDVKDEIDETEVFKWLKKMPKGGLLHIHGINNAWDSILIGTYRDDCWINVGERSGSHLSHSYFYTNNSSTLPKGEGLAWKKVVDERQKSNKSKTEFDRDLWLKTTQFITPGRSVVNDDMWDYFDEVIGRGATLLSNEEVYRAAILSALQEYWDDGIYHIELRGLMNYIVDNQGRSKYNTEEMLQFWLDLLDEFNQNRTEGKMTMRFIMAALRSSDQKSIYKRMVDVLHLQQTKNGEYVVGFDLVDEEYRYHSLLYYIEDFLNIQNYAELNHFPPLKFYFHAGETNWDKAEHSNLFDALLLNTTRIGHGFGLRDFPLLLRDVVKRKISVEISPISNQMLRLLSDMRNHPADLFMESGVPITISSDDPTIYGYTGTSHDIFAAFMSWDTTLASLKALAFNSITYSSLPNHLKAQQTSYLTYQWEKWINTFHV